jgi:hypothetical protein
MALKDKLGFSLHSFQRVTWVSEELKTEWELRLAALPEAIHDIFTSTAVMELLPVHVENIRIAEIYDYKKKMYSKGLFAEHVPSMPSCIQYAFGIQPSSSYLPVITGHRKPVVDFIAHLDDLVALELITQLPTGTIKWWNEFSRHDVADKQWAYLSEENGEFKQSEIYETEMLNPCWSRLGIMSLPFNPSTLNCPESIVLVANIRSIAQDLLPAEIYNNWHEILSWPTEWTALHGIAEIKTPLFKMIYNTDASGSKYTLQFKSSSYPKNGLNGLLFPYKKPSKLFFSESEKFKSGVDSLKNN